MTQINLTLIIFLNFSLLLPLHYLVAQELEKNSTLAEIISATASSGASERVVAIGTVAEKNDLPFSNEQRQAVEIFFLEELSASYSALERGEIVDRPRSFEKEIQLRKILGDDLFEFIQKSGLEKAFIAGDDANDQAAKMVAQELNLSEKEEIELRLAFVGLNEEVSSQLESEGLNSDSVNYSKNREQLQLKIMIERTKGILNESQLNKLMEFSAMDAADDTTYSYQPFLSTAVVINKTLRLSTGQAEKVLAILQQVQEQIEANPLINNLYEARRQSEIIQERIMLTEKELKIANQKNRSLTKRDSAIAKKMKLLSELRNKLEESKTNFKEIFNKLTKTRNELLLKNFRDSFDLSTSNQFSLLLNNPPKWLEDYHNTSTQEAFKTLIK